MDARPFMIVECKAPSVKISEKVFDQIAVYNLSMKVPYLLVTNGFDHVCCEIDFANMKSVFLRDIPPAPKES
jgi:hypothetical protein